MIPDKSVLKMLAGKGYIILDNFIVVVISEFKIGLVKDLIVFDMTETVLSSHCC